MTRKLKVERAQRFRALHARGTFVIANCWDGGTARILTSLGFPALATSSGASAGTLGRLDGNVSIDEAMAQARIICAATPLPVSADLEKGFGDGPDATAKAIRLAAATRSRRRINRGRGRQQGSALSSTGLATERVAAAAEARANCPSPSRSPRGPRTIYTAVPISMTPSGGFRPTRRAGADVLFAPGLPDLAAMRTVCASLTKPVNFMVGIRGKSFSVAELRRPACGASA